MASATNCVSHSGRAVSGPLVGLLHSPQPHHQLGQGMQLEAGSAATECALLYRSATSFEFKCPHTDAGLCRTDTYVTACGPGDTLPTQPLQPWHA